MSAQIPVCTGCKAPLVMTFAFNGKEFVCLDCGRMYGWLEPDTAEATAELEQRRDAYKQEWIENAAAIIPHGARVKGCERCDAGEDHHVHRTPEELEAQKKAFAWLRDRSRVAA